MPWSTCERRVQKKKRGTKKLFPRTRLTIFELFEGLWLVDPFLPPAPVLGPEQKELAISPSSAVHGGQYDTRVNMWHSSSYCMRHSCRTQFGTISLNQLVELACCRRASTTARHSAISHARSSEARTCRSDCDNGSKQTALVTARMLSSISSSLCFRNQRRYRKLSGQKMKLY